MMPRLDILVILYKCRLAESATLRSLMAQSGDHLRPSITIWDNSPVGDHDEAEITSLRARFGSVDYLHRPENTPLSQAYNRFLGSGMAEAAILLDQDSDLPEDYLSKLDQAIQHNPDIPLFVPRVFAHGRLMSPGRFGSFKGRSLPDIQPGRHPSAGHTIVTSGMALRRETFQNGLKFNEDLWLYAVDTDFFLRFRDRYPEFLVLDLDIVHGSALRSELTLEQRLFRFRNLRWSQRRMMRSLGRDGPLLRLYLLYLSLKHAIRYRSLRFLSGWNDSGRN